MYQMTQNVIESSARSEQSALWAAWIRRIAGGDMDALAALYDESAKTVFSLVLHILQDRQAAEETLIETYDRVRREAHRFSDDEIASTWLIMLARDVAVAQLRLASDGERLELFEQRRRIVSFASDGLTKEQSTIIQMTYWGGFTAEEVAGLMGVSVEYVRRQIVIAMNRLRGRNLGIEAS